MVKHKDFSNQKCSDSQAEKRLSGGKCVARNIGLQNFMAPKLKGNVFVLPPVAFISIRSPFRRKNSLKFRRTVRSHSGKEGFQFKKLLELAWTFFTFLIDIGVRAPSNLGVGEGGDFLANA